MQKYLEIPATTFTGLPAEGNFQHLFTKPTMSEINLSTFILSQQLYG